MKIQAVRPAPPEEPTLPEQIALTWNGENCDSCSIKAVHKATKEDKELNLCGHHTREYAPNLLKSGFIITPENYSFS